MEQLVGGELRGSRRLLGGQQQGQSASGGKGGDLRPRNGDARRLAAAPGAHPGTLGGGVGKEPVVVAARRMDRREPGPRRAAGQRLEQAASVPRRAAGLELFAVRDALARRSRRLRQGRAAQPLEALQQRHRPGGIADQHGARRQLVTRPDRSTGRHQEPEATPQETPAAQLKTPSRRCRSPGSTKVSSVSITSRAWLRRSRL